MVCGAGIWPTLAAAWVMPKLRIKNTQREDLPDDPLSRRVGFAPALFCPAFSVHVIYVG